MGKMRKIMAALVRGYLTEREAKDCARRIGFILYIYPAMFYAESLRTSAEVEYHLDTDSFRINGVMV